MSWMVSLDRVYYRFLFRSCSPLTCVLVRVTYAAILIVYVGVWMLDGSKWFSDAGVMRAETARALVDAPIESIFQWIPTTPWTVNIGLAILMLQSVCLLVGVCSRFQAACIFVWLVSFQSRNPLILDGEDTVFRIFAFSLIFMPTDYAWSLGRRWWYAPSNWVDAVSQAWGLRLIQTQMILIYLSAAWSKFLGETWRDGSAMFYVYQMDDLFGRGPLPMSLLESEFLVRTATWSVLAVESILPIALCFRRTRLIAVCVGIALHLSMEYAMNLFLFQWIMIVGLLSFVDLSGSEMNMRARSLLRREKSSGRPLHAMAPNV